MSSESSADIKSLKEKNNELIKTQQSLQDFINRQKKIIGEQIDRINQQTQKVQQIKEETNIIDDLKDHLKKGREEYATLQSEKAKIEEEYKKLDERYRHLENDNANKDIQINAALEGSRPVSVSSVLSKVNDQERSGYKATIKKLEARLISVKDELKKMAQKVGLTWDPSYETSEMMTQVIGELNKKIMGGETESLKQDR